MQSLLYQDVETLANDFSLFQFLKEEDVILITGATGLLGSLLTKTLLKYTKLSRKNIHLILAVRNISKARELFDSPMISYIEMDITDPIHYTGKVDYIFHFACNTSSSAFVKAPVDTISSIVNGTQNILQFAHQKQVKSMIFLSSLEVYGTPSNANYIMNEKDFGYLDCSNIRSSYSEGKRLAETLCVSYQKQYNLPVKIIRLCQTFGAGVAYDDNRVFAYFARSIVEKKDIILHTHGNTLRNYCYTTDAIRAMLVVCHHGNNGEAYNVANKAFALTIKEMADYLIQNFSPSSKVILQIVEDATKLGFNPEMKILLDTNKIEQLGWQPTVSKKEAFQRLINYFKEQ